MGDGQGQSALVTVKIPTPKPITSGLSTVLYSLGKGPQTPNQEHLGSELLHSVFLKISRYRRKIYLHQSSPLVAAVVWLRRHVPTLCNPIDWSKPGFPVIHCLLSFLKLMVIELMMPSIHLILCCPPLLFPSVFPASGYFPISQLFASGGQSIETSASVSVLPMNIQG